LEFSSFELQLQTSNFKLGTRNPKLLRMDALLWLLLEAAAALGLLVFIVWWTWPRRKKPRDEDD